MKRYARSSGLLIGLVVLVAVGAVGVYYITLPSTSQASSTTNGATQTSTSVTVSPVGSTKTTVGSQDSTGQPQGAWASYLGYVPKGYQLAAKSPYSSTWPCPAGMAAADCKNFQATCGNGVCDPNERCDTCPLDCGVTGALVCDPYTGRAGAPAAVCQIQVMQQAQAALNP